MFIEDNDTVPIKIYYKKLDAKTYEAFTAKELETYVEEADRGEYKELNVKMKVLTWGLYNEIQDSAMTEDMHGDRKFVYRLYKENRLNRLLVEWDAKDKEGKEIKITEKVIGRLAPQIPEAIIRAYDDETFLSEGEEKN
jgi:hypothetical protein